MVLNDELAETRRKYTDAIKVTEVLHAEIQTLSTINRRNDSFIKTQEKKVAESREINEEDPRDFPNVVLV